MKIKKRAGCFETNSSSAHTVTYKKPNLKNDKPVSICIEKANFDYCDDIVEGYEAKANYLWDIIMQHSSNGKWIMRFITYLSMYDISVSFNRDWIYNETWIEPNLPYDSEGEELLTEYLSSPEALLNFLFNNRLVVKLYEG